MHFSPSFSNATNATQQFPGGNSPSATSVASKSSSTAETAAPEPVLVAVQDMMAAFASKMEAKMETVMRESEGRTATRFAEALQAIQFETREREGSAIKNTIAACRADMEGYYQQALAASEARSAEGLGRALERLDRLEKTSTAEGKKYAKTHRELRGSVAAAEERANAALAEHRTQIEKQIAERFQDVVKGVNSEVLKRFEAYDDDWEAMVNTQKKLEDMLVSLEDRQADLDTELHGLGFAQAALMKEKESVHKIQEDVNAALDTLKGQQESADHHAMELETRLEDVEQSIEAMAEKQANAEKEQPILALNSDLADAEARICKIEVQLADLPRIHKAVWEAIENLEKEQESTDDKLGKTNSLAQALEKTVKEVQGNHASIEAQVKKLDADFCNWRTSKQLSILNDELETRKRVSTMQNTLEGHEKKLKDLRTDIDHEATQRRKILVKTTGMALAFANDSSLSGIRKVHYPAIKAWLDDLAARPAIESDIRARAVHYSSWLARNL